MRIKYKIPVDQNLLFPPGMVLLLSGILVLSSCEEYLDLKPDKKMVIPASLSDCQAILDNYDFMNAAYPYWAEMASDNYYVNYSSWNAYDVECKDAYIWAPKGELYKGQWSGSYRVVLYANTVLENLAGIKPVSQEEQESWNTLKGSALFFRAYAFYQLAQHFALAYDKGTAGKDQGIPLKMSASIDEDINRASVQETYRQIISDLSDAVASLPLCSSVNSRPDRVAAFGALARTYMVMQDYANAGIYADSCLLQYNTLLDYNTLDTVYSLPFPGILKNEEILFAASTSGAGLTSPNKGGRIDTLLFNTYAPDDLRRVLFFKRNEDGSYQFKGSYTDDPAILFTGIATDEIYMLRAECFAREGNVVEALADLNSLMEKRWRQGAFVPFTAVDANEALDIILQERRKELLYRCIRWSDLRRLNKEPRFTVSIKRALNNGASIETYELPPGDLRYTFLIPQSEIELAGISQNPR